MKDLIKIVVLAVMAGAAPAAAENPGTGAFAALQLSAGGMDIVMPEAKASRVPDPQGTLKKSFDEGSKPELAGIIGGMAFSWLIAHFKHWPIVTPFGWMAIAFVSSAVIGIVSGFYPAWKASKLDPIDALHYE